MNPEEAGKHRENIALGIAVEIFLKGDRSRKNPVQGKVKKILTHSKFHPHGIMVELEDGQIGRIQKICSELKILTSTSKQSEMKELDFADLIGKGENELVEYKSSALWSKNYTDTEIKASASRVIHLFGREASKVIIAKAVAGFLNTHGGHLIIGIKENKTQNPDEIIGIESEFEKLEDQCIDGYRRMIVDEIVRKYFHPDIYNHFSDYIKITFPEIDGKILCWIQVKKSDVPAFLTIRGAEYFFIRLDAETRELDGKQMVEYCGKRYNKK